MRLICCHSEKNKYAIRSRISEPKFRQIMWLFALDIYATLIIVLAGLNRKTIDRYLRGIWQRIAESCETLSQFASEIEVDEPCFGAKRIEDVVRPGSP